MSNFKWGDTVTTEMTDEIMEEFKRTDYSSVTPLVDYYPSESQREGNIT